MKWRLRSSIPPPLPRSLKRKSNNLAAVIENSADVLVTGSAERVDIVAADAVSIVDEMNETAVELGIWLSGLESFLASPHSFGVNSAIKPTLDASKEFRLTHAALSRCAVLFARLSVSQHPVVIGVGVPSLDVTAAELEEFGSTVRDLTQIGECYSRAEPLRTGEWNAWRNLLDERIRDVTAIRSFIRYAESCGEIYLPEPLKSFAASSDEMTSEQAELALVLPRFAQVLKWLSVVGRMLEADEPLKPALLIFSKVNEQCLDLIIYINNRLERFPDKGTDLFTSLDGASYLASIELKKVFTQELSRLIYIRPSPSIYSGMETAYSVLNESFQHILAGLVRFVDPSVDGFLLFPSFRANFEQSFALRSELWSLSELTKSAEANPEKRRILSLNQALRDFMNGAVKYLFYKDTETFERFVEEVMVAKEERDLVPNLHRFGAYLDTLFGQVNMRAVLEKHPFEPPKK